MPPVYMQETKFECKTRGLIVALLLSVVESPFGQVYVTAAHCPYQHVCLKTGELKDIEEPLPADVVKRCLGGLGRCGPRKACGLAL